MTRLRGLICPETTNENDLVTYPHYLVTTRRLKITLTIYSQGSHFLMEKNYANLSRVCQEAVTSEKHAWLSFFAPFYFQPKVFLVISN